MSERTGPDDPGDERARCGEPAGAGGQEDTARAGEPDAKTPRSVSPAATPMASDVHISKGGSSSCGVQGVEIDLRPARAQSQCEQMVAYVSGDEGRGRENDSAREKGREGGSRMTAVK